MNEEIKEILDRPIFIIDDEDFTVNINDKINNYITNLQEENQKLKEQLNCKEYFSSTMPENTEFVILTKNNYDRQQKDLALENIELKQENEKLNKIIDEWEKYLCERRLTDIDGRTMVNCLLNKLTELKKEVE